MVLFLEEKPAPAQYKRQLFHSKDLLTEIRVQDFPIRDHKMALSIRLRRWEVTLNMAANMNLIVKRCFSFTQRFIDRFHVQQLATEAAQEVHIKYR